MTGSRKTDFLLGVIAVGVWVIAAGQLRQLVVTDVQAAESPKQVLLMGCAPGSSENNYCQPRAIKVDDYGVVSTRSEK
ncbi:hypothetical protein [Tahibacter amnicola]|uniref:Uncharacterized protein n=1 Tax=Tahibacter amnicola TaxID=2976241 RepID=A0ABY6B730_9GAMM|nr:hypothetical protein [Tahibacter amnicola]UXI65794.1 hypothetical protein N4264_13575 [Tahibacter amnicola]